MLHRFFFWLFFATAPAAVAQKIDSAASAVSSWQRVRIQRSGVSETAVSRIITFNEPFLDNQHHWPVGLSSGYTFTVANGAYSIQRAGKQDGKAGRAFIALPDSVDLNRAATFVLEVDMVVPQGGSPESGLLLGASDAGAYTLFVLRRTTFLVSHVVKGTAAAGLFQPVGPAVVVNPERNTLRIEKHDDKLFFSVNGQDVPGDPLAFRRVTRNSIGFISAAAAVTFQNLRVTVGTL